MHTGKRTAEECVAVCLAIADECGGVTGIGPFAEGYRSAAADIRARIETRLGDRRPSPWERELRDVEVEARTVAKILGLVRRHRDASESAIARRTLDDLAAAIDDIGLGEEVLPEPPHSSVWSTG